MKKAFLPFILLLTQYSFAQYKNDNVSFKTVYLEDLCNELQKNPGKILLDVRSQGEYDDTSSSTVYNIGRLKGAKHIDIQEMGKRIHELDAYKNTPVFVYCSHSQRSRRVSKMLADSGFTKVMNINGGLSTFHLLYNELDPCATQLFETNNKFAVLSPAQVATSEKKADYYIIDLRNDSAFRGISTDEKANALGKFKKAVNISPDKLLEKTVSLSHDKNILLVDDLGNESPKAARILADNGFQHVSILFNGLDGWVKENNADNNRAMKWSTPANYELLNGEQFDAFAKENPNAVIVDVRKKEEYENKSKDSWRNIGNIRGAVNLPYETLKQSEINLPNEGPLILYSFGSPSDLYESAKILTAKKYKVYVLTTGLFSLRWRANNIKDRQYLKDWVVNIPDQNL